MTLLWLSLLLLHPSVISASSTDSAQVKEARGLSKRLGNGPLRQLAFTASLPSTSVTSKRRKTGDTQLYSSTKDNKNQETPSINELEIEVLESTRSKMDYQVVRSAILGDEYDNREQLPLPRALSRTPQPTSQNSGFGLGSRFSVAVASGTTCALASYIVTHSVTLGSMVFGLAWLVALGDPMEEEGPAGAVSRIIGRTTIQSLEKSSPKVRAVARAVVDGDDPLQQLQSRVHALEADKAKLQRQLQQRTLEDELLKTFTVKELKELAKERDLATTGNKVQLVERLVDHGELTSFSVLLEKPDNKNM